MNAYAYARATVSRYDSRNLKARLHYIIISLASQTYLRAHARNIRARAKYVWLARLYNYMALQSCSHCTQIFPEVDQKWIDSIHIR